MEFKHRDGWVSGRVAIALRTRAELSEEGTFEVPEDLAEDPGTLQRLIDAGHEPVDPDALPDGVEYGAEEEAEEAEESDGDDAEGDTSEESDDAEEEASEADGELSSMDRSELWELAHSEEFEEEPPFTWNESSTESLTDWITGQREEE